MQIHTPIPFDCLPPILASFFVVGTSKNPQFSAANAAGRADKKDHSKGYYQEKTQGKWGERHVHVDVFSPTRTAMFDRTLGFFKVDQMRSNRIDLVSHVAKSKVKKGV